MSDWHTVSSLSDKEPERPNRAHAFQSMGKKSKMEWLKFCRYCGLVPLKNERTRRAIKAGC